jgi:hypothetical protein
MADVARDGTGKGIFLGKHNFALNIKPHKMRNLQLAHATGRIRQRRSSYRNRIAGN